MTNKIKTKAGETLNKIIINIWEPVDILGESILGDLWRDIYLTIQDAIGLGLLFKLFSWIFKFITGEDFVGLKHCFNMATPWQINRYFCLVVVLLGFSSCITLAGRIVKRFFIDVIRILR